jgi:hypothetical protein
MLNMHLAGVFIALVAINNIALNFGIYTCI